MNKKQQFAKIESFIVYYGKGQAETLASYDLAIVEPSGQEPDFVKKVKSKGNLVLAYISVVELPDYSPLCKYVKEEDFLIVNGKIARNEEYHNNMMDLDSPRWISTLKYHVGDLLFNYGYDGVFMDTIGDVESVEMPLDVQNRMLNAAVLFVKDLRKTFPDCLIVQNSGLEKLMHQTAPYLDGICWENPPFESKASAAWIMARRDFLVDLFDDGKRILYLTEGSGNPKRTELTQKNADLYNFPYYHAENGFTSIVD